MLFTTQTYLLFFATVFVLYWAVRQRRAQNLLLLVASYVFYGWVHPWFCGLLAFTTSVDYVAARGMEERPQHKRRFLLLSLISNLGLLGTFKYFDFFAENVHALLAALGFDVAPLALRVFLPAGISFYTFQSLSYTIDVYRGHLRAERDPLDFLLFTSFFPQLVAGPIERATRLLPQVTTPRRFELERFLSAWPLLVGGFFKKVVVADTVAVYADKIFMLERPSGILLAAGTFAFTVQILADFSAYTDIARGSARLLGFELMENFDAPYLAISPSDFWRRWHISLSTWIRDYLYVPLGGARVASKLAEARVLAIALGLSGLWHGAEWHFVAWGLYYAALLFLYRAAGLGGRWKPRTAPGWVVAWATTFAITMFGWALFRAPSLGWLVRALAPDHPFAPQGQRMVATLVTVNVALYAAPLVLLLVLRRGFPRATWLHAIYYGLALLAIAVLGPLDSTGFIYFQF